MKDGQYFRPTVNEVYTNKNGSQYLCLSADGFDAEMIHTTSKWYLCLSADGFDAEMIHTTSKWRFKALGCHMYDDGQIEWNWSIGGYFDTAQRRTANDD